MPFVLEHNFAGIACPRFQCDKCGALITDASGAMLFWDTDTHQNDVVIPTILCKECDESGHPLPYSMELDTALVFLLDNCRMTDSQLEVARETARLLASI